MVRDAVMFGTGEREIEARLDRQHLARLQRIIVAEVVRDVVDVEPGRVADERDLLVREAGVGVHGGVAEAPGNGLCHMVRRSGQPLCIARLDLVAQRRALAVRQRRRAR